MIFFNSTYHKTYKINFIKLVLQRKTILFHVISNGIRSICGISSFSINVQCNTRGDLCRMDNRIKDAERNANLSNCYSISFLQIAFLKRWNEIEHNMIAYEMDMALLHSFPFTLPQRTLLIILLLLLPPPPPFLSLYLV